MKRHWFYDEQDGTYYRNCPLIMAERKKAIRCFRFRLEAKLSEEWGHAYRRGVIRKPELERGDVLVHPAPFRESYPDHPKLWELDKEQS